MAQASKESKGKVFKKLTLICLLIAVCLALVVGGTYALFSLEHRVTNHLSAGNLSAELVRDKLVSVTLKDDGHFQTLTDEKAKSFDQPTTESLFGSHDEGRIAPGCSFTADMRLTNRGLVAFHYWVEIKLDGAANDLAKQLKVTVTPNGGEAVEKTLGESLNVGSAEDAIGTVDVNKADTFTVKLEFTNVDENNAAQRLEVGFDFIVHAVQVVD